VPYAGVRNGRAYVPVLEDTSDVGFHVTLFGARRSRRGGNRIGARVAQYDARWFTEPLAETHAVTRAATIRRHYCHYGDDLGDGPLTKVKCALTSSALRAYIPPSLLAVSASFSLLRRSSPRLRLWPSVQRSHKPVQVLWREVQGMIQQWQSSETA
jgi:hypothetical protein